MLGIVAGADSSFIDVVEGNGGSSLGFQDAGTGGGGMLAPAAVGELGLLRWRECAIDGENRPLIAPGVFVHGGGELADPAPSPIGVKPVVRGGHE